MGSAFCRTDAASPFHAANSKVIDGFVRDIRKRPLVVTELDEKLWLAVIDRMRSMAIAGWCSTSRIMYAKVGRFLIADFRSWTAKNPKFQSISFCRFAYSRGDM